MEGTRVYPNAGSQMEGEDSLTSINQPEDDSGTNPSTKTSILSGEGRSRYSMNYQSYEATRIQPGEQTRRMLDYMFPGYQRRDPRNWYEMQTQTDLDGNDINPLIGTELIESEVVGIAEERKKSLLETFADDLEDEDAHDSEKRPVIRRGHRSSVVSHAWEGPPIRMAGKSSHEGFHLEVDDYYHEPQTILVPREVIEHQELKMDIVPDDNGVPKVIIYLGQKDLAEEDEEGDGENTPGTIVLFDGKENFERNNSDDGTSMADEDISKLSPVHSAEEVDILMSQPEPEPEPEDSYTLVSGIPVSEEHEESQSPEVEKSPTPEREESPSAEPEPPEQIPQIPEPEQTPEPQQAKADLPGPEISESFQAFPPFRDSLDVVNSTVIRAKSKEPVVNETLKDESSYSISLRDAGELYNSILLEPIRATGSHQDVYEEIIGEGLDEIPRQEPSLEQDDEVLKIIEPAPREHSPSVSETEKIPQESPRSTSTGNHSASPPDNLFGPLENYPNDFEDQPFELPRQSPLKTPSPSPDEENDHPLKLIDDYPPQYVSPTSNRESSDISRWLDLEIILQAKDLAKRQPLRKSAASSELSNKTPEGISTRKISPDKMFENEIHLDRAVSDNPSREKPSQKPIPQPTPIQASKSPSFVDESLIMSETPGTRQERTPPKNSTLKDRSDIESKEKVGEWLDGEILNPAQVENWVATKILTKAKNTSDNPTRSKLDSTRSESGVDKAIDGCTDKEILVPALQKRLVDKFPRETGVVKGISETPEEPQSPDKEVDSWISNELVQPAEAEIWVDEEILKPAQADKWVEKQVLQPAKANSYVDRKIMKPASAETWVDHKIMEPAKAETWVDALVIDSAQRTAKGIKKQDNEEKPRTSFQKKSTRSPLDLTSRVEDEDKRSPQVIPISFKTAEQIKTSTSASSDTAIPSISILAESSSVLEENLKLKSEDRNIIDTMRSSVEKNTTPDRSAKVIEEPSPVKTDEKLVEKEPSKTELTFKPYSSESWDYLNPFQAHPDYPDERPSKLYGIAPFLVKKTFESKEIKTGSTSPQEKLTIKESIPSKQGTTPSEQMTPKSDKLPSTCEGSKELEQSSNGVLKRKPSLKPREESGAQISLREPSDVIERKDRSSILAKKAQETNNYLLRDEDYDYVKPRSSSGSSRQNGGSGKSFSPNGKKKCPIANLFKKKKNSKDITISTPSPFSRNVARSSSAEYLSGSSSPASSHKVASSHSLEELMRALKQPRKISPKITPEHIAGGSLSAIKESSKELDSTVTGQSLLVPTPKSESNREKSDTRPIGTSAPVKLKDTSTILEHKLTKPSHDMPDKTEKKFVPREISEKEIPFVLPEDLLVTGFPKFRDYVDTIDKSKKSKKAETKIPNTPKKGIPQFPDYKDLILPRKTELDVAKNQPIQSKEVPKSSGQNFIKDSIGEEVPVEIVNRVEAGKETDLSQTATAYSHTDAPTYSPSQNVDDSSRLEPLSATPNLDPSTETGASKEQSNRDTTLHKDFVSENRKSQTRNVVEQSEHSKLTSDQSCSTEPTAPGLGIPRFPDYNELTANQPLDEILGQPIDCRSLQPSNQEPQNVLTAHPYQITPTQEHTPDLRKDQILHPYPHVITQTQPEQHPHTSNETLHPQRHIQEPTASLITQPYGSVKQQSPYSPTQLQLPSFTRPDHLASQKQSTKSPDHPDTQAKLTPTPVLMKYNYSQPEKPLPMTAQKARDVSPKYTTESYPNNVKPQWHQVPDSPGVYVSRRLQEPKSSRRLQLETLLTPSSPPFKISQEYPIPMRPDSTSKPNQQATSEPNKKVQTKHVPTIKKHNYSHPEQPLPVSFIRPTFQEHQPSREAKHEEILGAETHQISPHGEDQLNVPLQPGGGIPKFPDYPTWSKPVEKHPPLMTGDHGLKDTYFGVLKSKTVTAAEKKVEIENEMLPIMQQIANLKKQMYELTPEKGPPIRSDPNQTYPYGRLPTSTEMYNELERRTMAATKPDRDQVITEKRRKLYEENARRKIQRAIERSKRDKM